MQYSLTINNARLDQIEILTGVSAVLQFRTGAPPANCAAASTGTALASLTLPSDWLAAASAGSKAKSGTWEQLTGTLGGTIGHFRVFNSALTVCHIQGTVTATGGGGDCTVDSVSITAGQAITVTSWTHTSANL